jgi:N-methylhydantoinase A/oxoprolinase/acetone carboxylase beta subunit
MGLLVNIDNGGTFTDVCVSDGARVVHAKATTTPHDLTQCFVDALRRASTTYYGEEDLGRLIRDTDYLRYSTTSGTNAVVERKGTPVALLVERGEEQGVYGAAAGAGALWRAMVPTRPAGVRVGARDAIDEAELIEVINRLLADGAQRLVVALRSDAAEHHVKNILLERYPRHLLGAIPFLLSCELVQDRDHARRTVTAVVNSYLHVGMEHFLYGAENVCNQHHLRRPLLIFRNDGDSARVAKTTAVKTWGSGPRGGVEGAAAYAELYAQPTLVGMDIGGTTTDITVLTDGRAQLRPYGMVEDLPTSLPLPDLHSFGLGGSSVVRVIDGAIRIGPDSVGAAPGPACFGRGGTDATLTDALLLAGILDAGRYLGGQLRLDAARAAQAVEAQIARPLGVDVAAAVERLTDCFARETGRLIAAAVRGAGREPGAATLLAYGGGGPMIICRIAAAAGIRTVIVPHLAAVFSAFGIGFSHLAHAYQIALGDPARPDLAALRQELQTRAVRDMVGEGVDPRQCEYALTLWSADGDRVREVAVDGALPAASGADPRLTLHATFPLPAFSLAADDGVARAAAPRAGSTEIRLGSATGAVALYAHAELEPGHTCGGPALVRGDYLTCLVEAGWTLRVTRNHDWILRQV